MLSKLDIRDMYEQQQGTLSAQERGRILEQIICHLLDGEALEPELGPKYRGEQIDISFRFRERFHLLEMKWHSEPIQAGDLYAFRGKLAGKLVGTIGLFLSISGYTTDAVQALAFGKEINILLFDEEDLKHALSEDFSFGQILDVKLRRAAAYGDIYYAFETYIDTKRALTREIVHAPV